MILIWVFEWNFSSVCALSGIFQAMVSFVYASGVLSRQTTTTTWDGGDNKLSSPFLRDLGMKEKSLLSKAVNMVSLITDVLVWVHWTEPTKKKHETTEFFKSGKSEISLPFFTCQGIPVHNQAAWIRPHFHFISLVKSCIDMVSTILYTHRSLSHPLRLRNNHLALSLFVYQRVFCVHNPQGELSAGETESEKTRLWKTTNRNTKNTKMNTMNIFHTAKIARCSWFSVWVIRFDFKTSQP